VTLVATDLWPVDKLANGTEKTQRLTLRGRYGELQRFFFDDINGAEVRSISRVTCSSSRAKSEDLSARQLSAACEGNMLTDDEPRTPG